MNITRTAATMLLGGVATAAMMGQASALEAQAFVDRIAEVYKTMGYDFAFGTATLDGDTITVDGGTVSLAPSDATGESMAFDTEIVFSGVVENADGSYVADSVSIPDIDTVIEGKSAAQLTLSDIRVEGFYLPAGNPAPATGLLQLFESFSTGPLTIVSEGREVLSIEAITSESVFNPAFASTALTDLTSTLAITGISVDLSSVGDEDPAAAETIATLGLTTLTGDVYLDMDWTMADGNMALNEFSFDFAEVGAFDITAEVTGFTPAVLDQIYAMQASMGSEPTAEQAQAQMMQGMALMQGVSIVSASVRYDDASLAGKLLDFFAAQSGADRATFVAGLKAALPGMLAESGIPALNDLVVPPVSAFLDDPQSLEVKVAPPSPTSLLVLMAAAANPAGLITALGLAVEANMPAAQ